jgi:acyl-CoA thioesterase
MGFITVVEMRHAPVTAHPDAGRGRVCLWVRRKDGTPITPALAAYLADMVPMSIARACGVVAGGTSLDNTIRIGSFVESEWVLIDLRPHLAVGDYGHGAAHVWSEDGHLMATASQTASMLHFDIANPPWVSARS